MTDPESTSKMIDWNSDQVALFQEQLRQGMALWDLPLTPSLEQTYTAYAIKLVQTNAQMNLTAITDPAGVAEKHFVDSLSPFLLQLPQLDGMLRIADVGTGAGFPGLPIAMARPQWNCVLMDSLQKRCRFLSDIVMEQGLKNVEVLHGRAEDIGQQLQQREKFNLVLSRAVARLPLLLELCLPLVKVGGLFIALKGSDGPAEVEESRKALSVLGGVIDHVKEMRLPISQDGRTLIVVRKTKGTPKAYPRKAGTPSRNPLI
ncbi:16S rRNA (guanine(527)-N(7))-methyltransferase RsmG [Heliobacterium chlorum]|uniref:Ribosomal RNA small subunit methyltransferase G n=1 Tax=Heliobacterium chlorum TaxID=2698 RepID=A0ABR7T6V9_HELCL|nr:16S rRNA (guanine(527)-N(7))-methyltransferase RsmG [Heliobacterium chlorum]MBC9785426.1 16S rRNA (guanine(527)-N(7))-methyltransferase RsmG [Heliobacterium chlorum]